MERRNFLKQAGTAGALGLIGGWLGLEKVAEAATPDSVTAPVCDLTERDETWGDVNVHIIEMTLPFDNPAVFFQREGQRLLVPRQRDEEIRYLPGKGKEQRHEAIEVLIRERLETLRKHYVEGIPPPPLTPGEICRGVVHKAHVPSHEETHQALLLIAHQPQGTEYGLIYGFDKLTKETMLLTSPATMLFRG